MLTFHHCCEQRGYHWCRTLLWFLPTGGTHHHLCLGWLQLLHFRLRPGERCTSQHDVAAPQRLPSLCLQQTGSGKTFTMEGPPSNRGVNFRALEELFRLVTDRSSEYEYSLKVSMLEIYNESVQDLLAGSKKEKLDIRLVCCCCCIHGLFLIFGNRTWLPLVHFLYG